MFLFNPNVTFLELDDCSLFSCMDVLVEEMVLLAFLKNTAFGKVVFSNFTKSLPGFAFFFLNGDRAALLSFFLLFLHAVSRTPLVSTV